MNITSWSDQDLESLCLPENHKITFDGYEYWWYHKMETNGSYITSTVLKTGKSLVIWLHYINGIN